MPVEKTVNERKQKPTAIQPTNCWIEFASDTSLARTLDITETSKKVIENAANAKFSKQ